jgi:hypothetical protein
MIKQTIALSLIATTTLASILHAETGIKIEQPSQDSKAKEVGIGAGIGVGIGAGATAAALSAAGIAAVPHAAGGMILISTATGASYIAGTLGLVGGAAACVASVACAVAVAGGTAIAVGGGYYAYESYKSKKLDYDDVINEDKHLYYKFKKYVRIKDKFITPEKRDELKKLSESDEFEQDYYVSDGVMLYWGLVNDHYYVTDEIAQTLKSQFQSGGLYEVDAKDAEK